MYLTNFLCNGVFFIRTGWKDISWLSDSERAPKKKEIFFTPRPNPDNFSPKSVYKKIVSNLEKEIIRKMEIQPSQQQMLTYIDLCAAL